MSISKWLLHYTGCHRQQSIEQSGTCLGLENQPCVHKVCTTINDNLLQRYVSFPSGEDLKTVIRGYKDRWGFPNCGGAIDGTHVPIIAPAELVMQAVCDHKYIFRNINIGWPGRVHAARIFANSEIFHMGENGTLFPNWDKKVKFQGR